jgi:hypothetical protein
LEDDCHDYTINCNSLTEDDTVKQRRCIHIKSLKAIPMICQSEDWELTPDKVLLYN